MIADSGDMYIPINEDGFPSGVLFVERFRYSKVKGYDDYRCFGLFG